MIQLVYLLEESVMARWLMVGGVLCVLACVTGCPGGSSDVPVNGTVAFKDGKALPDGQVTLIGEAGGAPEVLTVKDGKFEGKATPGKKKVEIRAFKTGQMTNTDGKTVEGQVNYLAARYNTQSKLTAEVSASGLSPSKFEVEAE
jgi:hypothetical protein